MENKTIRRDHVIYLIISRKAYNNSAWLRASKIIRFTCTCNVNKFVNKLWRKRYSIISKNKFSMQEKMKKSQLKVDEFSIFYDKSMLNKSENLQRFISLSTSIQDTFSMC